LPPERTRLPQRESAAQRRGSLSRFKPLLMIDTTFLEFIRLLLRACLTSKLWRRVAGSVVVLCPDEAVTPGNPAAVHAPDIVSHLPLCGEGLGGEDKPIDPEEDETSHQVGDYRRDKRPKAAEQRKHPGQDRRRELPPDEIQAVSCELPRASRAGLPGYHGQHLHHRDVM